MTPQPKSPEPFLPDPDLLRYYNEVVGPGAAQKIVDTALEIAKNREQLEHDKQRFNYQLQVRDQGIQILGQIFAFVVAITGIGGGLWLSFVGLTVAKVVTGGVITSATVGGIVTAFLKGRRAPPELR
jgi:uncharacterized membrane protein